MPAFVIADIEVTDPQLYEQYRRLAASSIEHYGGRLLVRAGARCEVLEGSFHPKRLVLLEFTSMERAKQWYDSEEYGAAKAIRHRSAKTDAILVEGG